MLANSISGVLLSEKTAQKIFGKTNPLGKILQFENLRLFTVEGIIKKHALLSHIEIEALFSLSAAQAFEKKGLIPNNSENWKDYKNSATYALLKSTNNIEQFNKSLTNIQFKFDKTSLSFKAQSVENITPWNESIRNDWHAGMSKSGILTNLFLILALTMLSAFNFISLSLARSLTRAQEVGIRKAAGATRSQIIFQFLIEAIIIAFGALALSTVFVNILYGYLPFLTNEFKIDYVLIIGLLVYTILTGIVAGAVPAWLLSAFQPIQVLRKLKNIKLLKGVSIYKFLIVIQFSVTIMITVFFVIITDYERKASRTIADNIPPEILILDLKGEKYEGLENEIAQLSQVKNTYATNWLYDAFKHKRMRNKNRK
jgi:putative ABC transport system permease protein